jgi:hypothetical protein
VDEDESAIGDQWKHNQWQSINYYPQPGLYVVENQVRSPAAHRLGIYTTLEEAVQARDKAIPLRRRMKRKEDQ